MPSRTPDGLEISAENQKEKVKMIYKRTDPSLLTKHQTARYLTFSIVFNSSPPS